MPGITKGIRRITNSREQVWKSIGARDTTTLDAPCVIPRFWSSQEISKDSSSSTSCRTAASDWHAHRARLIRSANYTRLKLSDHLACKAANIFHIDIGPYIAEIDQCVGSEPENVRYHWSWRSFFGPDSPMPI